MIHRMVKMSFDPDKCEEFMALFLSREENIKKTKGCLGVKLWRDTAHPNIFFTYSIWESAEHLEAYRQSDFFADTWQHTKALFNARAEAWSLVGVEEDAHT